MILLFSWVIFRFHVDFPGCMYSLFSYMFGLNFKLATSKRAMTWSRFNTWNTWVVLCCRKVANQLII